MNDPTKHLSAKDFRPGMVVRMRPQTSDHPDLAGPWTAKTIARQQALHADWRKKTPALTVTAVAEGGIDVTDPKGKHSCINPHLLEEIP